MAIALDGSTPAIVQRALGTSGTAATASFSPPANSLVVVNVVWMWKASVLGSSSQSATLSCTDNHGNTYTRKIGNDFRSAPFQWGRPAAAGTSSAIFEFYYTGAPGATTVTVTASSTAPASAYLVPQVLTGAASSQTSPGMAHSGTQGDAHCDFTQLGSWAYVCGGAPYTNGTPVNDANCTTIGSWKDTAGSGCTAAAGKLTSQPVTVPGIHWLGWIQRISECSVLEILPAAQALPPALTLTNFQVMTADLMNNWLVPSVTVKPADTTISASTTLTADPDLSFPVAANAWYEFHLVAPTAGTAASNVAFTISPPSGSTGIMVLRYRQPSQVWLITNLAFGSVANQYTSGTGDQSIEIDGMLNTGSTAGNAFFEWAQQTASGTCTVRAGSILEAWRRG